MKLKRAWIMVAITGLAMSAAAACGDGDYGRGGAATKAPTNAAVAGGAASPTAVAREDSQTTLNVVALDFVFDQQQVQLDRGGDYTVSLENQGTAPHTFTIYADEEYTDELGGTERVAARETDTFAVTLDDGTTYYFRCEIHPSQMFGTITVGG